MHGVMHLLTRCVKRNNYGAAYCLKKRRLNETATRQWFPRLCPHSISTHCSTRPDLTPIGCAAERHLSSATLASPWLHRSLYDAVTCQNDHGHAVTPSCPWDPSPLSPGSRPLRYLLWPLPGAPDGRRDSCLSPSPLSRTPVSLESM